jgi:hypothetical protein
MDLLGLEYDLLREHLTLGDLVRVPQAFWRDEAMVKVAAILPFLIAS